MEILSDRYQIQTQLGKKAGRHTFLAKDLETQEFVVVKCLIFGNEFEWDDLKLFEREAETLKSLNHPAIPEYLDYFELELPNGKGFALVQSYIEAKSLEQHLKAGRSFTETEVEQLAEELLDILIYLHNQQPSVIHRDIKPSNILLGARSGNYVGDVYLVDFGSVQTLVAQEGGTITVVGTYGYMPPEQYGGRATPASDLYSLGATLIYLVTGMHPADLPQRNLKLRFREYTTVSETLIDWLEWLTEPDLENRLESAERALAALQDETRSRRKFPEESSIEVNQAIEVAPRMSLDQLFWNGTWRMGSLGAGVGVLIALMIAVFAPPSLFLSVFIAYSYLFGGLGLGLGFLNGLLIAILTRRYFASIKNPWRYRAAIVLSTIGFSAVVFGVLLIVGLLASMGGMPQVSLMIALVCATMAVTSQWFAEWYIRVSGKLPLNPRSSLQQPSDLTATSAQPLVPIARERVFWNAIWRSCAIATPTGSLIAGIAVLLSWKPYAEPLTLALYLILGGALYLGVGFFNGLIMAWLTSRYFAKVKNARLYRLILGISTISFSTVALAGVFKLLSALWLNPVQFILVLDVAIALSSQFFATWYLRETRNRDRINS